MKDDSRQRKLRAATHLKRAVLTLDLRPGEDVDEAAVSEAFGLSRTPLRELIRELAGEGYLELRAGRGARASSMSHTVLRDFFLAAPMVYGAILRLAARNATAEQISDLTAAQDRFKTALASGSMAERALANTRFHEITGEMANNTFLLPSFQRLLIDHARISMTFYQPQDAQAAERVSEASDQHDQIIAAIKARDETRAAALAEAHWTLSRDQIEYFVMPSALEVPMGDAPQHLPK
ncbi:MAG: GntR family transcriptional regulator [Pelagimonas sp.]|jgi:DNA-binding GntR family transcriptional regulator|nr:GntR family transcriptional regulator [Pelagimonas sp.]